MANLRVNNLTFKYKENGETVLESVDFQPNEGTFNLLVGSSGTGKSTLLKNMAGLYPMFGGIRVGGSVNLDGELIDQIEPNIRAKKTAVLFQNPSRQFTMRTVSEQLSFALENLQVDKGTIKKKVEESLNRVGIMNLSNEIIQTLSGGEQQKVALATILAMDSEIILLDEPFANIDSDSKVKILEVLKKLQTSQHKTIILSDHDWAGYGELADYVYAIKDKKIVQADKGIFANVPKLKSIKMKPVQKEFMLNWDQLSMEVPRKKLLVHTSLFLPKGKVGILSGENGVGKSSFLNALSQQSKYTGSITYAGKNIKKIKQRQWAKRLALIFQNSSDQFVEISVKDEIEIAKKNSLRADYWTDTRIQQALKQLNVDSIYDNGIVYQISGGQQKKVQVLSMLIMAQDVQLLDEPFAGLDYDSIQELMKLINEVKQALNISFLIVSHQRTGVIDQVDYELILKNKKIEFRDNGNEKNT
ncbi:ABC transporter ATP-binding protein [Pediococcus claussenii]|uniref:Heme ABC exporter, ATP-binding protein CcmA n=1 Tax=Pediococcus claussenii (strain ATCC BAA-344 / DSM 14800 / JCM 18046 / KCTC 3811 / LMG 21948 / P06) TaxID=701521 RepID=G8PAI6_PEDCP|nr:ABC transporter ATP-binding protein [Pediococcus claussenii]AEV95775.1 heme ABC exporter, ATP-binding protein CcmA [Pediococcus claussenii ATCC BAA-344]ANZ69279.1 hypothetical protein AYR57_02720 [Pediococcus claussenii]ANZ71099.1 hypothetical protein AYR58_02735 [Pediococcus claussenii]KRN20385.1 ccmA protein [Pediococcus claussenii]